MLVADRHRKIVELVNERKSISVSELSKMFSVTEATIRRDLDKLEKENLLIKTHGGAISIDSNQTENSFEELEILKVPEKRAIGKRAAQLVCAGDLIAIDASTTSWYMVQELPDIPITVLTNSIKIAMELSKRNHITVLSTGGILSSKTLSYFGPLAENSLSGYRVNKVFLSCRGIDLEQGLRDNNEMHAIIKKKMIEIADEVILMADSSKFSTSALSYIAPINVVNIIITDSQVDKETKSKIKKQNIELLVAEIES